MLRNLDEQKTAAGNEDIFLIKRNTEDQKGTATNADLL